jgi:tetratricopeptide (TPR) repeat protein
MNKQAAAVAALAFGFAAAWSAQASVQVVGSQRAHQCMDAAFAGASSRAAVDWCSAALNEEALTPRNRAGTLVNRGVIMMNRRQHEEAIRDFDQAVRLSPTLGEAHFNRGSALVALNRWSEGVADIEQGLKLGMKQPERAYYNRAIAREELNDARGAYLDYQQAARLKPEWDLPRLELARFSVQSR